MGDSDEVSFVAGCTTAVGSVMMGGFICSVGDVGVLVHPTSMTIIIKVKVARNMVAPVSRALSMT